MPQMIDTLKLFDSLKKSFTEEQAHLLSHLISIVRDEAAEEVLATKKDIKELEVATITQIKELEAATTYQIKELEAATQQDTRRLEKEINELKVMVSESKVLIANAKAEILKWMVGFLLAQTGVIAALVKLL